MSGQTAQDEIPRFAQFGFRKSSHQVFTQISSAKSNNLNVFSSACLTHHSKYLWTNLNKINNNSLLS